MLQRHPEWSHGCIESRSNSMMMALFVRDVGDDNLLSCLSGSVYCATGFLYTVTKCPRRESRSLVVMFLCITTIMARETLSPMASALKSSDTLRVHEKPRANLPTKGSRGPSLSKERFSSGRSGESRGLRDECVCLSDVRPLDHLTKEI